MGLLPEERERLTRYLDFMESELADFQRFSTVDRRRYASDRDLRRNLERWIENLVNCSIDMAKVILLSEGQAIPSTYREVLRQLGATRLFDEAFGKAISRWASLRNILAHEYLDLRWDAIRRFLDESEPDYRELVASIKSIL